jgi:hypothetical protein
MPVLNEEQKAYIVQALACYNTPSEVAVLVKEEYGLDIERGHVRAYNPLQTSTAQKWRDLFDATREAFLANQAAIGIAQQVYRLKVLDDVMHKALTRRNFPMVLQCLEQGAKDSGGAFTNQRQISGSLTIGIDGILAATDEGEGESET